jgi:PAS domain S-box-containing protein
MERFLDRRLARAIDHANALIFVVNARRRLDYVNRALAVLIGRSPEDLVGTDLLSWIPEAEHPELERALAKCISGELVYGVDLGFAAAGGVARGVFNISALSDAGGSQPGTEGAAGGWIVAIGQDSTAMRILEHQVIQAEKLATLGQLAAGVVHEINNPLTSITVYADYLAKKLRRDGGAAADVAMLDRIIEGSGRILKCVRDLVNYAKPSRGQLDVLSLNEVVEQSASFCEHILERAQASLAKELAVELPPLYGVQDQLQQVLINLITNACHAIAPGGRIVIRTRDLGDGRLAFEVEDNGAGIAEDNLEKIFDPFFTTKEPGQGTGLGLSIVKKIVDSHDGSILVSSRVAQGTRIEVSLPTRCRQGED